MRRRRLWLEIGIIIVAIALIAAWTRPRVEEPTATTSPKAARRVPQRPQRVGTDVGGLLGGMPSPSLLFVGKNASGFEEYRNLKDGTVLIKIPGGTFTMGSNDGKDDEKPPHRVTLPPYYIGKYDVTNSQFMGFVSMTGYIGSSYKKAIGYGTIVGGYTAYWEGEAPDKRRQAPVTSVNVEDATAYCKWAGLRLPTEEEWELAARGTQGYVYPWGNEWHLNHLLNLVDVDELDGTFPVGSSPFGTSPFGCLDMAGNVYQLTSSPYVPYPGNSTPKEEFGWHWTVGRGSDLHDNLPKHFRAASRNACDPNTRFSNYGFRCALAVP